MPLSPPRFLDQAADSRLLSAVADNHRQYFTYRARRAGGDIHRRNGLTWTEAPGPEGEAHLLFPRLSRATAGDELDQLLAQIREGRPLRSLSCWTLLPSRPYQADLGARLVARGFEWGWQPHWMRLDLRNRTPDPPLPDGLRIEPAAEEEVWEVDDLPNYHPPAPPARRDPRGSRRRFWRFGAWLGGKVVGHCSVYVTTGRLGVAGIYSCGVVPSARRRGIGGAVTRAACHQGLAMGCRYAVLNATSDGEMLYRTLGFESLGHGQTWWMHRPVIEAPPPSEADVAFVEAVGRGDVAALEAHRPRWSPAQLDAPLAGGMTLMRLAVRTGQSASADWLARHGATLDVIAAWDLGWKERLPELLAGSPDLINRRSGNWQVTAMHVAVERGDIELARVLLAAGPDLEIADTQFHSTPLGWARHLERAEIIDLIEQHQARRLR
jgi:ribosomal protein S18 acetylase RimI-like enzyme